METPKIRKLINVRGYVRGSEPVSSYRKMALVKVGEEPKVEAKSLETVRTELEQLDRDHHSRERDPRISVQERWDLQEKDILRIYGGKNTGVFDPGFSREEGDNFLRRVYDEGGGIMGNNYSFDAYEAHTVLTNPSNAEQRSKRSEELEKHIAEITGETPERIDPFTFRLKSFTEEIPPITNDIYNRVSIKPLKQDKSIKDRYFDYFQSEFNVANRDPSTRTISSTLDALIRGTDLNQKVIAEKIMPSVVATVALSPGLVDLAKTGMRYVDHNLTMSIRESLPEEMKNQSALTGDPEKIRTELKKALNNYKNSNIYKEYMEGGGSYSPEERKAGIAVMERDAMTLAEHIKKLKSSDIPIFHTYLMEHSTIFGGYDKPELMSNINKFSSVMTNAGFNAFNNKKYDYIHFSNNPMEVLTMSPQGYISSCQSISSHGEVSISGYNMNVASSLYGRDDFVIFRKQFDSNIKSERTSIHFSDNNDMVHQENKIMYSQPLEGEQLKNSLKKNKVQDHIHTGDAQEEFNEIISNLSFGHELNNISEGLGSAYSDAEDFVKGLPDRFDSEVETYDDQEAVKSSMEEDWEYDHAKQPEEFQDQWDRYVSHEIYEEYNDTISDMGSELTQSFLYMSPIHLFKDGAGGDEARWAVDNVIDNYDPDFQEYHSQFENLKDEFDSIMEDLDARAEELKTPSGRNAKRFTHKKYDDPRQIEMVFKK